MINECWYNFLALTLFEFYFAKALSGRHHKDGKPRSKMRTESYPSLQSHTPQPAFQQGRPGRCKHKCGQNAWVKPHRRRSHQFDIARS